MIIALSNSNSTTGRIYQLDFIKGVAILSVILHHILIMIDFSFTKHIQYSIGHAVPLFLIVTMLLYYNKFHKNPNSKLNYKRLFKSIILPFIIAQIILVPISILTHNFGGISCTIFSFGQGMGSYYVALFLQIVFLSKYIYLMLEKHFVLSSVLILAIHICAEIGFNAIGLPDWIYRILCIRYLWLYVLTYILFKKELFEKYKYALIILSIVGLILQIGTLEFGLTYKMYPAVGFPSHKFYRDFITFWFFVALWKYSKPNNVLNWCGEHSYYIYLIQMIVFPHVIYLIRDIL